MSVRFRILLLTVFISNIFGGAIVAAEAYYPVSEPPRSIFEALGHADILDVTIRTDLSGVIENRRSEAYQPAVFVYKNKSGKTVQQGIEVQVRGKFRRRVCDFPPLKLKFPKKELTAAGLEKDFNKLKLVTHCIDDKDYGNDNLLREYLIYKLYNELNPVNSFRVQLLRITYEDSQGVHAKIKRYGFLIEDTDEMAARVGKEESERLNVHPDSLSTADEHIMGLFQYMIGNADWSTTLLRNVKLVAPRTGHRNIPVPYDFDFAGLVNASYAIPQYDLGLRSVRDRFYLGMPCQQETMRATMRLFLEKEQRLRDIVANCKWLAKESRIEIIYYLHHFFEAIEPAYLDANVDLAEFFSLRNATMEQLRQKQATDKQNALLPNGMNGR